MKRLNLEKIKSLLKISNRYILKIILSLLLLLIIVGAIDLIFFHDPNGIIDFSVPTNIVFWSLCGVEAGFLIVIIIAFILD